MTPETRRPRADVTLAAFVLVALALAGVGGGLLARQAGPNPGIIQPTIADGAKYAPDRILVRFRPEVTAVQRTAAHAAADASVARDYVTVPQLQLVQLPGGMSVEEALARYRDRADVLYAEPDYELYALDTPNDPRFAELWGLHNTGSQPSWVPGADISAPAAWAVTKGSHQVVVAVVDTGVDYHHPDLQGNLYRNEVECTPNGVDDDHNGYVDDCYGIDTYNHTSDPFDDHYHGTHVSGTIGARGNNGVGVVGVNWEVSILPCKFLGSGGSGSTSGAIECLDYIGKLADRGVPIVASNNSWGGGSFSQALVDAIAGQMRRGILFIAAAGNASSDNDRVLTFPSTIFLPNVISVAASAASDGRARFSNYGRRTVHLAAPGQGILSTTPNNTYSVLSGTSMATPHVTGVAALLKAQDPTRDWRAIRNLLLTGGDSRPATGTVTGKRLNAAGSLLCTSSTIQERIRPVETTVTGHVGIPIPLAALHATCAAPAGNVTVTVSPGGGALVLRDDGIAPDQATGDGTYSGLFTPQEAGTYTLDFGGGDVVTIQALPSTYRAQAGTEPARIIVGTSLALTDDSFARLVTPFPVHFGGGMFSEVYVSANGVVSFERSSLTGLAVSGTLPVSTATTLIAPMWMDLYPPPNTAQNVYWAVQGTAPARELVIEWRDITSFTPCGDDTRNTVRFQVVLSENSDDVLFTYADTVFGGVCTSDDYGGSATVGVQVGGARAAQFSAAQPVLSDGMSLRWTTTPEVTGVAGTVTDGTTGSPLAGVVVSLYSASGSVWGRATTSWAGQYRFEGLAAGTYYAGTSNSLGYVDQVYDGTACVGCSATSGQPIVVATGQVRTSIDFALARGAADASAGIGLVAGAGPAATFSTSVPYAANRILVRFRPGAADVPRADVRAATGATFVRAYATVPGLQLLELPSGVGVADALARYRARPDVLYAEPDYEVRALDVPTDPWFGLQWALHNTGQFTKSVIGADINAPGAWAFTHGSRQVVVAVIDTGVDYTHPDLQGNLFRNEAECTPNGIDDDHNGYIDDCYGIDVVNHDSDPFDDYFHGTHISGTIGARGNNGVGVAGVNWDVSIVACKFLDKDGFGSISGAIECLDYVGKLADAGVPIVASNNSWGGGGYSRSMEDAIVGQLSRGILFIAAAGNSESDNDAVAAYPANYFLPNVLSVAATTPADGRARFSNYGRRTVHLAAPGENILSTYLNGNYAYASGTSMAAPHVTGVAALLKAQDPTRDWRAIRNLLLTGGDTRPALETVTGRRLNAASALACVNTTVQARIRPVESVLTGNVGVPIPLAALHVMCASPAGDVSVAVSPGGSTVLLRDDGKAPDQAAGDGTYAGLFVPQAAGTYTLTFGGGDTVTVTVLPSTYQAQIGSEAYRSIVGTGLEMTDDTWATLATPFPVRFGGATFNTLYVSDNGIASFERPVPGGIGDSGTLPADGATTLLAPFWMNLYPTPGTAQTVYWEVQGTAPARELVIEWRDLTAYTPCGDDTSNTVRFQIVLFENSDDVLFSYADTTFGGVCASADRGGEATVGVQVGGTRGVQFSSGQSILTAGMTLRWTTTSQITGLAGSVTDVSTGGPLGNVQVELYGADATSVATATTTWAGQYRVEGLAAGTYYARTSNSLGYADEAYGDVLCLSCSPTSGQPITVSLGQTTEGIDFALAVGGTISGTITDAGSGVGLGGMWAYIYASDGTMLTSALTATGGRYAAQGLPSGTYYVGTANTLGYIEEMYDDVRCVGCTVTSGQAVQVTMGATRSGVDFALTRGGAIAGAVTDAATGAGVNGVWVTAYSASGVWLKNSQTAVAGAYTLGGLPTGTYYVSTWNSQGYVDEAYDDVTCIQCVATIGKPIAVTLGQTTTGVNIALSKGAAFAGRVTDAVTGVGLAGVSLYVYRADGSWLVSNQTSSTGNYTVSGILPGSYFVKTQNTLGYIDQLYDGVTCIGCSVTAGKLLTVTLGQTVTGVTFALRKGAGITGRVTDAGTGTGLAGVFVTLYGSDGNWLSQVQTMTAGTYAFGGLQPGSYYAMTSNTLGYINQVYDNVPCLGCAASAGKLIPVGAEQTVNGVNFALSKGGVVAGTVTDAATGAPLTDVTITLYTNSGTWANSGQTSSTGSYTVGGLPSGAYYAKATAASGHDDVLYGNPSCATCSVTAGQPIAVTLPQTTSAIDFAMPQSGCAFTISPTSRVVGASATTGSVTVTAGTSCSWAAASHAGWLSITSGTSGTGNGTVGYLATPSAGSVRSGTLTIAGATFTLNQGPLVSVDHSRLSFGAINAGGVLQSVTAGQTVVVSVSGASGVTWTATSDRSWLHVTKGSGAGEGAFAVSVDSAAGLPTTGTVTGMVTVSAAGAVNSPATVGVTLTLRPAPSLGALPFGVFDTPADQASGLHGSFAITGWALDDVGIDHVEIWRDRADDEPLSNAYTSDPNHPAFGKVFIARSLFIDNARPDVEALYAAYPLAYRSGWGYLLLSQGLWNQGNGTYRLYAYAFDTDGQSVLLGSKTIAVDNADAIQPFGALDTPAHGGTVSGSFWNYGWALTPNAVPSCRITNGNVLMGIDSGPLHPVSYGDRRADIAASFPGFSNENNSGGAFYLDTSTLSNGIHQIGWLVTDSCGRQDGIGSRFFNVLNTTSGDAAARPTAGADQAERPFPPQGMLAEYGPVMFRNLGGAWVDLQPDASGWRAIDVPRDGRIEVRLPGGGEAVYSGFLDVAGDRRMLPAGSSLDRDAGIFYWQPGAGFRGTFDLVFTSDIAHASPVRVRVTVGKTD